MALGSPLAWGITLWSADPHKFSDILSSTGALCPVGMCQHLHPQTIDTKSYISVADPSAVQSKAWVCRRSLAGIVGSNPAGGGGHGCLSLL
jgi:hypothetical protein